MTFERGTRVFGLAIVLAAAMAAAQTVRPGTEGMDLRPTGKGWGASDRASRLKVRGSGISYHGGPVMTSGPNVYYIWYGNWAGNSATTILTDFANAIGGSPYFNINVL